MTSSAPGLYLGPLIILCMDTSGDKSDVKQAEEKSIGIEEQRTIERELKSHISKPK